MSVASSSVVIDSSHLSISDKSQRLKQSLILIVDDVELNRKVLAATLSKAGFLNVTSAVDGVQALEKTRLLKPDLVILDLLMPKMDGFEYCRDIRADALVDYMPIIVQTILNEREARLRALSCGADDFLNKPLDPAELVLRCCIHLERHFMLRDVQDAHSYLHTELDEVRTTLGMMTANAIAPGVIRRLGQHCEMLEQMTCVSPFAV